MATTRIVTRADLANGAAAELVPAVRDLEAMRAAADGCRACPIGERATQAVLGEGALSSRLMLVGEQPGDVEDAMGRPFVGPAGKLLDRALADAGIDRASAYVTNAVKHFKWEPRGKRRIHQRPNAREIDACGPWLAAELEVVHPEVLVVLGATAAQALIGPSFRVTQHRGELIESPLAPHLMATVHPSSILRAEDDAARALEYDRFVEDLRVVVPLL